MKLFTSTLLYQRFQSRSFIDSGSKRRSNNDKHSLVRDQQQRLWKNPETNSPDTMTAKQQSYDRLAKFSQSTRRFAIPIGKSRGSWTEFWIIFWLFCLIATLVFMMSSVALADEFKICLVRQHLITYRSTKPVATPSHHKVRGKMKKCFINEKQCRWYQRKLWKYYLLGWSIESLAWHVEICFSRSLYLIFVVKFKLLPVSPTMFNVAWVR